MKLTREKNPKALARYAHIRPAGGWRAAVCGTPCAGIERTCTRQRGHSGPHVAHGFLGRVVAVWDSGDASGSPPRRGSRGRSPGSRRPVGLRTERPSGGLERLLGRVLRLLADPEQLFLLVLFVAFVGFALHWLWLILG